MLIALSILGLLAAVAIPQLSKRLDSAFADADLAQVVSSARLLPVRLATLGIELKLDAAAMRSPLPDGRQVLDLPLNWQVSVERPPIFGRSGSCDEGSLVVTEPAAGLRWRISFAPISCQTTVTALQGSL